VTPILEVIACSVADAIEAERGGASRLEIIRDFERGGLTPPLELVRNIVAAVSIPVRVMLRENDCYTVAGEGEVERLCKSAHDLSALQIDGVVLGFLRRGGIDGDMTQRVLACATNLKATFHHAFEDTTDRFASIEKLKQFAQVDRILASGGSGDWPQKIVRLSRYELAARPQIMILAGGGLNREAIRAVRAATGIREFHVGRAARISSRADDAVSAALVEELVQAVEACPVELREIS
jgi:copper homeostasis protein